MRLHDGDKNDIDKRNNDGNNNNNDNEKRIAIRRDSDRDDSHKDDSGWRTCRAPYHDGSKGREGEVGSASNRNTTYDVIMM